MTVSWGGWTGRSEGRRADDKQSENEGKEEAVHGSLFLSCLKGMVLFFVHLIAMRRGEV